MILNCVIIDDDPLALAQIKGYVEKTPTLSLMGAYESAIDAVKEIRNEHVDVLFIAIQMQALSGLEFVKILPESCRVVFTTKFKQYAFDGFKVNAVDYLLKPISFEVFQESCKKVRATFSDYSLIDPIKRDQCIVVRSESKLLRVALQDILFIESTQDYVKFHLSNSRKILTPGNLKKLESHLPKQYFKRVHRSFMANMLQFDYIDHMRIHYGAESIPISDSYKSNIMQFIDEHSV